MKIQRRLHVGGRVPGEMILDALRNVIEAQHCKRRWKMDVAEGHGVSLRCFCKGKGRETEIERDVWIRIPEPVNPRHMYSFITAEPIVSGTWGYFTERQIIADLETIEREFKKCFDGYPWPYRAFDNQK